MEREKYIKVANERFTKEVDANLKDYKIEVEDEKDECKVIYVPKKLQFGGGAEVIIDKKSSKIKNLIRYQ